MRQLLQLLLPAVIRPRTAWSATKILVTAFSLACLFWWLDAWVDTQRGSEDLGHGLRPVRSLWEEAFLPSRPALAERCTIMAVCLLTGLVAVWWVAKFRRYHRDLSRSEGRLALALDQAGLAVWEFDAGDGRTLARARWQAVLGIRDDATGNPGETLAALAVPDEYAQALAMVQHCLAGREHLPYCDYRLRRPDGQEIWVRDRVSVVERRPDGQPVRVMRTFQDVTAERQAEAERLKLLVGVERNQKLESLGALAGQVAHDFRNYLTAILGGTELAAGDVRPDSPSARALDDIRVTVRQATGICRQLLNYSGTGSGEEHPIEIGTALDEWHGMLKLAVGSRCDIRIEAEPDVWVCMDPSHLSQVLLNLVVNAAEAMKDRTGAIRICAASASEAAPGPGFVLGNRLGPGPHCALSVCDQGCGMDETTARRLFEPFYSTKAHGRGLGLATVLGIVRRCQGAVRVESRLGEGTCITLLLPQVPRPPTAAEAAPDAGLTATAATVGPVTADAPAAPCVVVADDDMGVRRTTGRLLARLGLDAVVVSSGTEALAYCDASPGHVSCVLLDLGMADMAGAQPLRYLRQRHPAIPVVLMTGGALPAVPPEADAGRPIGMLAKPFEIADLRRVLHECIPGLT